MRSTSLQDVALRVAAALGERECLLVGGLAVAAYGYVRATTDVDFVVRSLAAANERLRDQGLPVKRLRGDFACLRGAIGDVRFDILPPLVPIQWDLAITVSLGPGAGIRVVDLDGLIRLKLKAAGPKDLMDVAALVLRHPEREERAREVAVAYGVRDELDVWLRDPRLAAEPAESRSAAAERRGERRVPPAQGRRSGRRTPGGERD